MATCSYNALRGDKKTDDGSNLCGPFRKFCIMDAQVAGINSREPQFVFMPPSASPLQLLPSACPPLHLFRLA